MKIVVIGSRGRIGERLVRNLRQQDLRVFAATRSAGVDTVTGVGLDRALEEADVVIDVTNTSRDDGAAALDFFETSSRNLLDAGRRAGVSHHILLSIVGTDGLLASDYFKGKKLQEEMIATSRIPFTILRSTQFFEFVRDLVQQGSEREIMIAPALVQPISGEDLADTLADIAMSQPFNATLEVAGPEQMRLDELATEIAAAHEDGRQIIPSFDARYFGAELDLRSLLPRTAARIMPLRFDDWLRDSFLPVQEVHTIRAT